MLFFQLLLFYLPWLYVGYFWLGKMGWFGLVPKVVTICPALQTPWLRCWRGIPWGSGRFVCLMQWFAGRRLSVNGSNFRWFQRTSGKYWAKRFLLSASHWWLLRSLQQVTEQRHFWQPWSLLSLNCKGSSTWKWIFLCVSCSNLNLRLSPIPTDLQNLLCKCYFHPWSFTLVLRTVVLHQVGASRIIADCTHSMFRWLLSHSAESNNPNRGSHAFLSNYSKL